LAEHPHDHGHLHGARKTLFIALAVTLGYALVEVVGGAVFHSLALMSDAGHMVSDALALGLAAFASWLGSRPSGSRHSYGFARAEVVAAFVNGLAMLLVVVLIAVEAISRLLHPELVSGFGVMLVAIFGLLANLFVAFLIGQGERNLNTRAVLLHVIGDLIGSVAAITSGAVIYYTGWQPIDALLSLVIAMLILGSTVRLLLDALHVLMEGVPAGLTIEDVGRALGEQQGVLAVHDLHIWNISSGQKALSAHVDVQNLDDWAALLESARQMLRHRFGIAHETLQPEPAGGINPGYRARVKILPQPRQHVDDGGHRRRRGDEH
jgi:cobalt-zinc-cadmium efflux system protein